jgi:hypothetical protein
VTIGSWTTPGSLGIALDVLEQNRGAIFLVGDNFGDRADFEVPIATLQGFELTHFIGDLDPVSEILIFHYFLLTN